MKANRPSLVLYFIACILVVLFKIMEYDSFMLYIKSIIVPLVFIYYLITNNYKISWIKSLIFLFCFVGDIFNLLNFNDSGMGALLSFLLVYILLLLLAIDDFRYLKFRRNDGGPMFILFLFILAICISILSLKFEKMVLDFSLYIIYGITLSLLTFVSVSNYIKKGNHTFFNLVIMCVCFMVSDVFFVINNFYFKLFAFSFINVVTQIFGYFFMVSYFIENDKYHRRLKWPSIFY